MTYPDSPRNHSFVVLLFLMISAFAAVAQVPAPPVGAKVISRVEEATAWQTCGSCGNSHGTGATATYSMYGGITDPTKDGSSTKFQIGGPYPYKNAYWYIKHYSSPTKPVSYLKYEFDIYVPVEFAKAPQAIEFECQQKVESHVYNFAWQADYADHQWRTFNYTLRRWEGSGVSFSGFTPGKWHHVVAEFHAASGQVVHDALTIDGTRHVVNIKHPARVGPTGRYLTNAFQLDLNGKASPYHVYIDGMAITYK